MRKIRMGNDEFILYVRKQGGGVGKDTRLLGRLIWEWLEKHNAVQTVQDQECKWAECTKCVSLDNLPKTATQFEFDRDYLVALYDFLDTL